MPKVLGGTAIKPVERHGWEAVRYIIHNPETGEIFTRTPKSWALITLFYVIYYLFLAGFWAAMLFIFFTTLNDQKPRWIGEDGLIGNSPGLGLKPVQTDEFIDSSMIMFNVDNQEDDGHVAGWGGWAQRSNQFLKDYKLKDTTGGKTCSNTDKAKGAEDFCLFDVDTYLGPCAKENSGYNTGEPCVFLKLNKIYGVLNEAYNDTNDVPEEMPNDLKEHIGKQSDKNQVWIDCRGEYPADDEAMGTPVYYPSSRGFPSYYFPYKNQKGYQSPLVAVQFKGLARNQLIHVECRAWAKNIGYNKRDRIGINHLEFMVLTNKGAEAINKADT